MKCPVCKFEFSKEHIAKMYYPVTPKQKEIFNVTKIAYHQHIIKCIICQVYWCQKCFPRATTHIGWCISCVDKRDPKLDERLNEYHS